MKSLLLLALLSICLFVPSFAQSPDWFLPPDKIPFSTSAMGLPTDIPGNYPNPYIASNIGYDNNGAPIFTVVNNKVYNMTGQYAGDLSFKTDHQCKKIIIVPDPADCKSRIVFSSGMRLVTGGGSCYYNHVLVGTRIKYKGNTLTVEPDYVSYEVLGQCTLTNSFCISKPKSGGKRFIYFAYGNTIDQLELNANTLNLVSSIAIPGNPIEPADMDLSMNDTKLGISNAQANTNGSSSEALVWVRTNSSTGNFIGSVSKTSLSITNQYPAYGIEFVDNNNLMICGGIAGNGAFFNFNFSGTSAPTSSLLFANSNYYHSQIERDLNGKLYAAASGGLIQIDPATSYSLAFIVLPVFSNSGTYENHYALPGQLDFENYSSIFSCDCNTDITLGAGNYGVLLTESATWIKSSAGNYTYTDPNGDIELDANPAFGYIQLNPDFDASPIGGSFTAIPLDGCGNAAPNDQNIQIKTFIEGYFTGNNMMQPVLFNQGVSNDQQMTDWLNIELHDTFAPYSVNAFALSPLHTNGLSDEMKFSLLQNYKYLVLKHRNAIQTWSAAPISMYNNSMLYNFSNAASQAYDSNQTEVSPGVFAIYSGDINQDENADLLDLSLLDNDIANFMFGYQNADLNGDGNVDLLDLPILDNNIHNFIYSVHP